MSKKNVSTNGHGSSSGAERVALYLRVSSEEQREAGTIQTQDDYLERHAAEQGFELVEVYADDGVSGTIPLHERPEGRRLLKDAKEGKFDTVLVYRLDRLGRTQLGILDAADRLERLGVALRSATEHYETATPQGRLLFQMLGSFAEFERASIRERTMAGLHWALRNGKQPGVIPYGYGLDEDGTFAVIPEEAALIRSVFQNIAAGRTLYSEASRLNELGIPSPGWRYRYGGQPKRAGRWTPPTIRRILHRRAYCGAHEIKANGGRDTITREVPAIITPELREAALTRLADNKRFSGGKKRRNYLLSGLINCSMCGSACTGQTSSTRGKKYHYYKCTDDKEMHSYRGPTHRAPHAPAEWLEDLVWTDVRQFLSDPGEVLERAKEGLAEGEDARQLEERRADLSKRITAKHKERERWLHLYAEGHISDAELETHLTDLREQTDNLRLLLESVEDDLSRRCEEMQIAASTEEWLMTLRDHIEEVEGDSEDAYLKRRELVRLIDERITVGRDEDGHIRVDTTYRFGPPTPSDDGDKVVVSGKADFSGSAAPIVFVLGALITCAGFLWLGLTLLSAQRPAQVG